MLSVPPARAHDQPLSHGPPFACSHVRGSVPCWASAVHPVCTASPGYAHCERKELAQRCGPPCRVGQRVPTPLRSPTCGRVHVRPGMLLRRDDRVIAATAAQPGGGSSSGFEQTRDLLHELAGVYAAVNTRLDSADSPSVALLCSRRSRAAVSLGYGGVQGGGRWVLERSEGGACVAARQPVWRRQDGRAPPPRAACWDDAHQLRVASHSCMARLSSGPLWTCFNNYKSLPGPSLSTWALGAARLCWRYAECRAVMLRGLRADGKPVSHRRPSSLISKNSTA